MLPANTHPDPLVEIMRLAYRRGLLIRQQAEQEKNKTVDSDNLGGAALPTAQQQDPTKRSLTDEKL